MTVQPDPGGVFASDLRRHVLGHLRSPDDDGEGAHEAGLPMSAGELQDRLYLGNGPYANISAEELDSELGELQAEGLASQDERGWAMTRTGFNRLTGAEEEE